MSVLRRVIRGAIASMIGSALLASVASAAEYAPLNQPGHRLGIPGGRLAQSLRCTESMAHKKAAVLLVPPTLTNPDEAYFTYEAALDARRIPYCTLTIPHFTTQDIQLSAEYIVYALRTMHAETADKITILGWSQGGGPEPRWALRFWPDVRPYVAKLIDLEAPNHGTVIVHTTCHAGKCSNPICPTSCVPAIWQQADNSEFIAALNSHKETFPGISYTNVYSHTSDFVQPNMNADGTTSLHGGGGKIANIGLQDICPGDTAKHLDYYYDPTAYAIVIDALTHRGPADPARINRSVCTTAAMPYISPLDIATYTAYLTNAIFADRLHNEPQTTTEPPLKCYVTASCTADRPRAHERSRHR